MLNLYVMRHAKSSWEDPDLSDYQRPLNNRGKHNAKLMRKIMKNKRMFFDFAFISGSQRTVETFKYIKNLNLKKKKIKKYQYLASPKLLLDSIQSIKDKYKSALILNHEPTVKNLTKQLCSNFNEQTEMLANKFSTAAIATIIFKKKSWSDIKFGDGLLDGFIKPKDFY
jgi:phosphohistidine phosphatase